MTSSESLEAKKQQKEEDEKETERKKKEREEKRIAKESEKKQKQQERESKKAEQARKKEELARKKEEQAKKKDQQKKGDDKVGEYSGQKRKTPSNPAKTYPIRKRAKNDDTSSSTQVCHDICSVCLGCYKDDIEEETGDTLYIAWV